MPPKKKKTYSELEHELKRIKASRLHDIFSKTCPEAVKWGSLLGTAAFARDSIVALSGKITAASIDINAGASLDTGGDCPSWPYWVVGISAIMTTAAVFFALGQRQLRKNTVEHLAPYKEKYERLIDPQRTTSGLLNDGSTNPEDI